jgi:NADH-quinone oxidoreductase subunit L
MTLLALAAIALASGVLAMLAAGRRRRVSLAIGLAGSVGVLALTIAMPVEDSLAVGGAGLVGSHLIHTLAMTWSAGLVVVGCLEIAAFASDVVLGPSLVGLGAAVVALATNDPETSFAALAAGGVAGIALPGLTGWSEGPAMSSRVPTAHRGSLAILGSGLLAAAVVAWAASVFGPLGGDPLAGTDPAAQVALGAALVAMVAAVALRSGLIPLHVWAARFMEGVSPLAVPAAFTWGSAAFMLVALDWSQVALGPDAAGPAERGLVLVLALASVVFGGLAAIIHDDIEHVLGYSILQDAGIAVLAFASLEPDVVSAARDWLVASAAIKTALAAWAAVTRATFGAHRLADLGGWARRAPVLGAAFILAAVAAVGLPGTALFEARRVLVTSAIDGPLGLMLLGVAMTPLLYLGRVAFAGIGRMSPAVTAAPPGRLAWGGGRAAGWSRTSARQAVLAIPAELRANRWPLMAVGVVVLAVIGIVLGVAGTEG